MGTGKERKKQAGGRGKFYSSQDSLKAKKQKPSQTYLKQKQLKKQKDYCRREKSCSLPGPKTEDVKWNRGLGGELYFVFLALCLSLLGATWLLKLLLSSCQALSSLFANKS